MKIPATSVIFQPGMCWSMTAIAWRILSKSKYWLVRSWWIRWPSIITSDEHSYFWKRPFRIEATNVVFTIKKLVAENLSWQLATRYAYLFDYLCQLATYFRSKAMSMTPMSRLSFSLFLGNIWNVALMRRSSSSAGFDWKQINDGDTVMSQDNSWKPKSRPLLGHGVA